MYTLLVISIYTLIILIVVPLEKIAKAQTYVRNKYKSLKKRIEE